MLRMYFKSAILNISKASLSLKMYNKVQVGNDQEMAQSERTSHSINRGVGKNKNDT